ncbi:MAG: Ferredoxin--NADP reductase [Fibrobacterota bacterium]|jgi:ferredoxin--NADP+ reductase
MSLDSSSYNATLVARSDHAANLATFYVRPDTPFEPFISGQYVTLGLLGAEPRLEGMPAEYRDANPEKLVQRAYSIAAAGFEIDELEFLVSLVENGSLTPRLWKLQPGDRLTVGKKIVGSFTLDELQTRTVVMVGTGSGLAPFISMLRQNLTRHLDIRFVLLHGAPRRSELAYLTEFRSLEKACANFTYIPAISRPQLDPPGWRGTTGRLTQFFAKNGSLLTEMAGVDLDPTKTDVYLCGNPNMINDIHAVLEPLGYTKHTKAHPGALHIEEYWREKE